MPYGPLYFEVRRAKTPKEADQWSNFLLGLGGGTCAIDSAALANKFHCGPPCTAERRRQAVEALPATRKLVAEFRKLKGVWLLSQWGVPHDYRVNDLFNMLEGQTNEALPSPAMGFVPSNWWKAWPGVPQYLATIGAKQEDVERVIAQMRALPITSAVVREGADVRVIRIGIGDNQSGLLFTSPKAPVPRVRSALPDGREYTVIEVLEPGVIYFETT